MKKSILKNVIAHTFALGALVFVAGNVLAYEGGSPPECSEDVDFEEGDGFIFRKRCNNKIGPAVWAVRICAGNIPNSIPSVRCGSLIFFARPDDFAVECANN